MTENDRKDYEHFLSRQFKNGLCVEYEPIFIEEKRAKKLFKTLKAEFEREEKDYAKKRSNITFGDKDLTYRVRFQTREVERSTREWPDYLIGVKDKIEKLTGESFNICVAMRYPCGKVGIAPHRDKEMKTDTLICGISLGQRRTLQMSRGNSKVRIPLFDGSLYIFVPPTNDLWSHSIVPDDSEGVRYSLTFRNYA